MTANDERLSRIQPKIRVVTIAYGAAGFIGVIILVALCIAAAGIGATADWIRPNKRPSRS